MAAQNKQIKKLNVQNFLTFLVDASTSKAQHILDIKDGRIYTKITNDDKEFIKYASASLEGIGGDFSDFKDGVYRFYLLELDKIIKAFKIAKTYNKETINVKVVCLPIDDEQYIRIERLWLEGQLKLQISAKDASYVFHYMKDENWNAMLQAQTVVEFDLEESDVTSLKEIFSYLTSEDVKSQKQQGLHIHLTKNAEGQDTIQFTEADEKVFSLIHNKNVLFTNPQVKHFSFHAYIISLFTDKLYKVHIKSYGEVYILVATPSGDSPKTIVVPLVHL